LRSNNFEKTCEPVRRSLSRLDELHKHTLEIYRRCQPWRTSCILQKLDYLGLLWL